MKPAIVRGWDLPKEDYVKSHESGGLTKLVIDLSNVCNLSCSGCFTKRVDGGWNGKSKKRLPNEMSYEEQSELLEEVAELGVRTVDIVGAGEPTLDPNFRDVVDRINEVGMYAVVFTHGVSRALEHPQEWAGRDVSFFVKLWSRNPELQDRYVDGSIPEYAVKRDKALEGLIRAGLSTGSEISLDGIDYQTTRLGADILVMRSNYDEVVGLFRFCRQNNIMPEIKTYIPEGPTRFDQEANLRVYDAGKLAELKKDEVTPEEFLRLRQRIIETDKEEHGINDMRTIYPQGSECTQSIGALYVTITGDIRSCVGTHLSYGKYRPNEGMLRKVLQVRQEQVGFGCVPRVDDANRRGLPISELLVQIYTDGMK